MTPRGNLWSNVARSLLRYPETAGRVPVDNAMPVDMIVTFRTQIAVPLPRIS